MPPQARVPPAKHPVFIWPTPEHEDRLFYVERDGREPKYKNTKDYQSWDYGDSYPDSDEYPEVRLTESNFRPPKSAWENSQL